MRLIYLMHTSHLLGKEVSPHDNPYIVTQIWAIMEGLQLTYHRQPSMANKHGIYLQLFGPLFSDDFGDY